MPSFEIGPGQRADAELGTTIADLIAAHSGLFRDEPALAAKAYNRLVRLDHELRTPTRITPIYRDSREGVAVYRRTTLMLFIAAVRCVDPSLRLVIGQSLAAGYYFDVQGRSVTPELLEEIESAMRVFVSDRAPITEESIPVEEARAHFESDGHPDKAALLRARWGSHVKVVKLGGFLDLSHGPLATSAGAIHHFHLASYPPGLVLRFVDRDQGVHRAVAPEQQKLFQTYRETRQWNEIIGVPNVGRLNELIIAGRAKEIIQVVDGLHEKKIAAVADMIVSRRPNTRLVLISGPSSSGKTTFSKRLSIQLRVAGIRPVTLSLDNWYVDRVDTPRHPVTGGYDFECLEALDLELFNENLQALLRGDEVATPVYDFKAGLRIPESDWPTMRLADDQVLVAEGIHGLNDALTASIDGQNKFRVYVSALTQLCLDDHNRIFTSDTRLVRRIVRDARYRGYSAEDTISRWPLVCEGERKYIFPFQEQADVMFNSALVYEAPVLKVFAERFLLAVPPTSPAAPEAHRLLEFLEHFVPVLRDDVPADSILREFIGGSTFAY